MPPKIYLIFSQDLDNGKTGEFGIGEDGQAYWNGKPIVTEEKVVLQLWVNIALIVTAIAVVGQTIFAGLGYLDSHNAAQKTLAHVGVDAAEQPEMLPLNNEGKMFFTNDADVGSLHFVGSELKYAVSCEKDGKSIVTGYR